MKKSDKRRHQRANPRLRCWCEGENVTQYTRVENIGEGGLFLRTNSPLPRGEHARVSLGQEDGARVEADATVVWSQPDKESGAAGMGLKFEGMDDKKREKVRRLVQTDKGRK